jgi:hypothetical protein
MQVKLDLDDVTIMLGNNGITLTIAQNDGKHIGHLRVGQATVEWRKGRTRSGRGQKISLARLIELIEKERV